MSEPIDYTDQFRQMSMPKLLRWTAGWKPGCYERLAGEHEIQRRKDRGASMRGWIAIVLSVVSLVVAVIALLRK